MIELRNLTKIYNENQENQVIALDHASFALPESGMVFLLGKSGSGKTTMLNLLGGLDAASDGEIVIDGISSKDFTEADYDAYRNTVVGFVFQQYNLLQDFTVAGNLALALELQGKMSKADAEQKIAAVLEQVGLSGYGHRKPSELSGGQKQRVAIARALVKNPRIILADEPTGALDSKTGTQVFDVLKRLSQSKLVVVISHDRSFAEKYGDRIIELADGKVTRDTLQAPGEDAPAVTYSNTAVRLQKGTPIGAEEWAQVRAHFAGARNTTILTADNRRAALSDTSQGSVETVQLTRAKLPMKTALRMGLHGIKRKKLRLTVVVALCLVALLLFGMSDMFMTYDYRVTLANSVYDHASTVAAFHQERFAKYTFQKGWYGDYPLTDEAIAQLSQELGASVKGIYCPPIVSMSLENNYYYSSAQATNYGLYAEKISGFVDFSNEDLKTYGLSLLFGKMPDPGKDEIAISKYVAESFVLADYRPATPEVSICMKGEQDLDKDQRSYHEEISWSEYLKLDKDALKAEGKVVSIKANFSTEEKEVLTIEAMVGRTLFLGLREYKITGIIDTGFDTERYAEVTELDLQSQEDGGDLLAYIRASELEYEREYGLHCAAFVGKGKTAEIAAGYPKVLSIPGMNVIFQSPIDQGGSFSSTTIARMSDIDRDLVNFIWDGRGQVLYSGNPTHPVAVFEEKTVLQENEVIIPLEMAFRTVVMEDGRLCFDHSEMDNLPLPASVFPDKAEDANYIVMVQFEDHRTSINKSTNFWAVGRYDHGEAYESLYDLGDTVLVSDAFYEEVSEGREGVYTYAVTPMPKEKEGVQRLVDWSCDESTGVRYPLMSAVSYELEAMNSTFDTLATLFRYIAMGMAVFAALMFWNFISGSISQKKKELGIMRALGARGQDVFLIFFTESFIVAVANFLLGSLLTFGMSFVGNMVIQDTIGILLSLLTFTPRQVLLLFLLSFAVAIIGSSLPIWRIAKKKPVEVIRET